MINEAGGQITGNGTLTAPITDDGLITAAGGALTIDGAITGTGEALAGPGATLTLTGAVGHKVTAGFAADAAASGVLALSSLHFLGEITGFAAGDAIDLLNTNASAASFSGSALLITLTNGDTLTLALTAAQTGALTVTTGAHGDSLITFAGAAAAVIDRPASASTILPHASLPPDLGWLTAFSHAHPW
jgi:hypothetical protein